MAYEIIPENQYLQPGQTQHLTPTFFNQIFANINAHSMSNSNFLRPVQVVSTIDTILWRVDSGGTYDSTTIPQTITLTEVGSNFMPEGWTVSSFTFTPDASASDWLYDVSSTAGNTATLSIDSSYDPTSDTEYKFNVAVVYTDPNGVNITTSADYSLPIQKVVDGADAINTPVPIISIPTAHEPLSAPGGSAIFKAHDVSWLPVGVTPTRTWTLTDSNGVDKSSFINDPTAASIVITIPDIAKNYVLKLNLNASSTDYFTDSRISTYDYGSFLFSSWGDETPVDNSKEVTLIPSNLLTPSTDQVFPGAGGKMEVKWGKDMDELSRLNASSPTSDILTIPGFSTDSTHTSIVQSLMNEYNLPSSENVQNYSLVELNDATVNLVGEFFWTTNMSEYAEIIYKASSAFTITAGLGSIANNSIYLVKGVLPFGVQTELTVGPGSERYYVHLKHYDLGPDQTYTYVGDYDQYSTITQSQAGAPIKTVFNGVPLGKKFRASVVGANGSSYSAEKLSEQLATMSSAVATPISAVTTASQQYGLELSITLDSSAATPIGFIASHSEMDPNVEFPAGVSIPRGATSMSQNVSSIYSSSPVIKIPAGIGNKVAASVYAVMADGSVTNPVDVQPTTVSIPWSYLETGLSKHLGRFDFTESNGTLHANDTSIIDNATPQHNLTYTSFGRDIFLETVIAWVHDFDHSGGTASTAKIKLQADGFTDANDEKEMTIGTTVGTGSVSRNTKYTISDLSVPIPAGSDVVLAVQQHTAGWELDVTLELHFSNGIIVTSNDPIPDDNQAGGGGNPL